MKQNYFITLFLFLHLTSSLSQELQGFESMLRQGLAEYNLLPSTLTKVSSTFQVEMQDDVKEHLSQVVIVDHAKGDQENKLILKVNQSVAKNFQKTIFFQQECLEEQSIVYLNLLQRIFTSPNKDVYFTNIEDIIHYFVEETYTNLHSVDYFCKEDVFTIQFKKQEATNLLIKIKREDELREDMMYDMKYKLTLIQSNDNKLNYTVYNIDVFTDYKQEINIYLDDELDANLYANNNQEILEVIIQMLPNDYEMKYVKLDQIQHDFRLGSISRFFKLKTYNGSFVFSSTYFEDEDNIGQFELRIFKVEDYYSQNFKLQERDMLVVIPFYRVSIETLKNMIKSLKLDELLNTIGYEIAQMYIQEIKNTQYHNLHIDDDYNNDTQTLSIQPINILPLLTIRNVITTDNNDKALYSFKFSNLKGFITIDIINNIIQDIYQLDFNVKFYSKNMVRKFIESSLQINKKIEEA